MALAPRICFLINPGFFCSPNITSSSTSLPLRSPISHSALAAMNLPSSADVESLRAKVDDLERLLTSVERKVDALLAGRPTP